MKKNLSKLLLLVLSCGVLLVACSSKEKLVQSEDPQLTALPEDATFNFDWVEMYNTIVDDYRSGTPFFYVSYMDLVGDNEEKYIGIDMNIVDGTTDDDMRLFLVWLYKEISDIASEQDYRFTPSTNESFGSFFDVFTTKVICNVDPKEEGGEETLWYYEIIKPGHISDDFDPLKVVNED